MTIPEYPITREEMYLNAIVADGNTPDEPVTRKELFLAKMSGQSVTTPLPVTREELYLDHLSGGNSALPENPITRKEIFLASAAGQDVISLEPVTRSEMYLSELKGGSPSKNYLYNWDLTKSLVDTVSGQNILLGAASGTSNATQDGTGLHFTAATQNAYLGNINPTGKTFEIDVSQFVFAGITSTHIRFFMLTSGTQSDALGSGALIWKSKTGWSAWGLSGATGITRAWSKGWTQLAGTSTDIINAFSGKTVKVVFDKDGHTTTLFLDGVLVGTITDVYFNRESSYVFIGGTNKHDKASGDQCYNMTITGIRVYENEEKD